MLDKIMKAVGVVGMIFMIIGGVDGLLRHGPYYLGITSLVLMGVYMIYEFLIKEI